MNLEICPRCEHQPCRCFPDMSTESEELADNERWMREVLTDFRIPFDDHKIGRRLAFTRWMSDRIKLPEETPEMSAVWLQMRQLDMTMRYGGPSEICGAIDAVESALAVLAAFVSPSVEAAQSPESLSGNNKVRCDTGGESL